MLLRYALALVAALFISTTAYAADKGGPKTQVKAVDQVDTSPAPHSWAGPWIGLNMGYAWQTSTAKDQTGTQDFNFSSAQDAVSYGGAVGYNLMLTPKILAGVEFTYDRTNSDKAFSVNVDAGDRIVGDIDIKSIMMLGGRLGYLPTQNTLLYVKGGMAWVDWAAKFDNPTDTSVAAKSLDDAKGWFVGAGVEHMLSQGWTAKLEYVFIDLGNDSFKWDDTPNQSAGIDHNIHTVRLGFTRQFNTDSLFKFGQ